MRASRPYMRRWQPGEVPRTPSQHRRSRLALGPESKPVLGPNFPSKGTTDAGKFIDFSRFLESANGGAFEWGTGSEEKARRQARERRLRAMRGSSRSSSPWTSTTRRPSASCCGGAWRGFCHPIYLRWSTHKVTYPRTQP